MPCSTFATPGYSRSAKGVQEVRREHFDGRHLSTGMTDLYVATETLRKQ